MQRYFVLNNQIRGNHIYIFGDDYHHIKNVMRMSIHDKALFCNQEGIVYLGSLENITKNEVVFTILEQLDDNRELSIEVVIAHGLVKRPKQEEVIRRLVELGASKYIPVLMERSIVKIEKSSDPKKERLERIVKEASEQCHRNRLLEITDIYSFEQLLKLREQFDLALYAYEEKRNLKSFKDILRSFTGKNILVLVGPEGGISDREVKLLEDHNFLPIGLGPRILRTETAPLYIMSAISYELELGENNES